MVAIVREGRMEAEDVINIIRSTNPNIVINRVSQSEDLSHTVELTAQGDSSFGLSMNVNNLISTLREINPAITVERVHNGRSSPLFTGILEEDTHTQDRPKNKRSAYGMR